MVHIFVHLFRCDLVWSRETRQLGWISNGFLAPTFDLGNHSIRNVEPRDTEAEGSANDQELEGMSVGYSMGGISIAAHSNEATNIANQADNVSEHTEISVSFAF